MPAARAAEKLLVAYFAYTAALSLYFPLSGSRRFWIFAVLALAVAYAWAAVRASRDYSLRRDLAALAFTLVAYRQMNQFRPDRHTYELERQWIVWDRLLLDEYGMRARIESLGMLLPGILELAYLVVYAVGPFGLLVLYWWNRQACTSRFLLVYLVGTLGAYALFPYFPSEPPRAVFPGLDLPGITTAIRDANLRIVGGYGIHSSVFPSAHVSSAFSAAWGLLVSVPREKRWIAGVMAGYAALVAAATVYGRYHYAVDAAAGFGVSLVALGIAVRFAARR
ncbi:MAG: phosphatase PAP2 family protein [Bryobacteraceae bacterium]|nr:phosphatase PAP2 family protein [Bryobacteraceae bacterium]